MQFVLSYDWFPTSAGAQAIFNQSQLEKAILDHLVRFHHRCCLASREALQSSPGTRLEVWGQSQEGPSARDMGCHVLWAAEDLQVLGVKGEKLLALPGEKTWLYWMHAGERAAFVAAPALFYVKNERVKSVGWKFL